jgi:hypothetical protein
VKHEITRKSSPAGVEGYDRPPTREELPSDLTGGKFIPLAHGSPLLLAIMARKKQKVVPLPDGLSEKQLQRLRNLSQYNKGRSFEGQFRCLQAMGRRFIRFKKMADITPAPKIPDNVPLPVVPTAMPDMPHSHLARGRALKVCMSREEYDLYAETWITWFQAHAHEYLIPLPDGREILAPEDEMDVHRICMETVNQYRIERMSQRQPSKDFSRQYDSSVSRMQKARENLNASRRLRMDQTNREKDRKSGNNTTVNVAVLASAATAEGLQERIQRQVENQTKAKKFLESTVVKSEQEKAADE